MTSQTAPRSQLTNEGRLNNWFKAYSRWELIWWSLIVGIGTGSAFVASSVGSDDARRIVALLVAAFSATLAALRPEQRARANRAAWIELDLALRKEKGERHEILSALKRGEDFITGGYFPSEGQNLGGGEARDFASAGNETKPANSPVDVRTPN